MASKLSLIITAFLVVIAGAAALTIESPSGNTTSPARINITENQTVDALSYVIMPGNIAGECANCSMLTAVVNLTAGDYTLSATSGNGTASMAFSVVAANATPASQANTTLNQTANTTGTTNQTVTVNSTTNSTNVTTNVTANITTNITTNTTANITTNTTANMTANATTNTTTNITAPDQTGNQSGPRFTLGLNKLPKAVENGEIGDAELAAIIRNSSINPGVLNRLIKTGKLGNESITAIIETQRTPKGIFGKIAGFFGIHVNTAKENLAEAYNLTAEQEEKLLKDPDVSEKVGKKIAQDREQRIPPGQAKKEEARASDSALNDTPKAQQGQAKKEIREEQGNGTQAKGKPAQEEKADAQAKKAAPGQEKKQK